MGTLATATVVTPAMATPAHPLTSTNALLALTLVHPTPTATILPSATDVDASVAMSATAKHATSTSPPTPATAIPALPWQLVLQVDHTGVTAVLVAVVTLVAVTVSTDATTKTNVIKAHMPVPTMRTA